MNVNEPLLTGFFAYVTSLVAFSVALYYKVPVTIVYDKFLPLMTSAVVFSFVLAVFLYIKAKLAPANKRAPGGNTGMFIVLYQPILKKLLHYVCAALFLNKCLWAYADSEDPDYIELYR